VTSLSVPLVDVAKVLLVHSMRNFESTFEFFVHPASDTSDEPTDRCVTDGVSRD
jgi:hypothetical protein